MSREQDAARARGEATQAAKLLAAIEVAVGDALADCTDADASEGYKALLAGAPKLRHAIVQNAEDLARENGFTYPRGERATRNLDAVRAMLHRVEAFDPDEYAAQKRRERAAAAASEAAKLAALAVADERLIAARSLVAELQRRVEGVNYALNSSTIDEVMEMGREAAGVYYAGLRADGARLGVEIKEAWAEVKVAEAERATAYSVVDYAAARDSDARHTAAAYERVRIARLSHCETESL